MEEAGLGKRNISSNFQQGMDMKKIRVKREKGGVKLGMESKRQTGWTRKIE